MAEVYQLRVVMQAYQPPFLLTVTLSLCPRKCRLPYKSLCWKRDTIPATHKNNVIPVNSIHRLCDSYTVAHEVTKINVLRGILLKSSDVMEFTCI